MQGGSLWQSLIAWIDTRIAERLRQLGIIGNTIPASSIAGDISGLHDHTLESLSDVAIDRPIIGQVLGYSGEGWGNIVTPGGSDGVSGDGRWEPVTSGDDTSPELVFAGGDVIMAKVIV